MIKLIDILTENNEQYLYHATYGPLLDKIEKNGLDTSDSEKAWDDSVPGYVYLAKDLDVATSYAEASDMVPEEWLDEIIVLTIDKSKLDLDKLFIDQNVQDNEGDTLEYRGVIPWGAIKSWSYADDIPKLKKLKTQDKKDEDEGLDEMYPPYKSNMVSKVRYKTSDIWTNDQELAVKKGYLEGNEPKKGTGKKPEGSSRRLYTDENPKDTVSVKFKSAQDIKDTLSKASFKSKKHARKSQIINLIHQRVRVSYDRAKDPEVKKRLKRALDYIEKRKEASKRKTKTLNKETADPQSGKAAPYGSGYAPIKK